MVISLSSFLGRFFLGSKVPATVRRNFDRDFYLSRNPDVAQSDVDPVEHYFFQGWREGRNPTAYFSTTRYLKDHPDVEKAGINPFYHYLTSNRHRRSDRTREADIAGGAESNQESVIALLRHYVDNDYYLSRYTDVGQSGLDPAEHYVTLGAGLGYDPAPSFSTRFYLETYPDIERAGVNPFWHYVVAGQNEGRQPRPDLLAELRLLFDEDHYCAMNPDVVAAGADPFVHFMTRGWVEGRDPASWFDVRFYRSRHGLAADVNPLEHFVREGQKANLQTHPFRRRDGYCVHDEIRTFANPSKIYHEERDPGICAGRVPNARAMALYLPQFHSIPENDAWWGKGFTEWRNVARGVPRFKGHYQPRIPEELGHYDLGRPDVMQRQVKMAREAGLEGFCFYYYWFNGKRILEKPLDEFLGNQGLDCSFSILWANENWTRRWDGFNEDILLRQDYRPEDDEAFMADLARYFQDRRYLRIAGRPLFIIYRPGLIPEARATIERWRRILRESHGIDPWFFMTQGFDDLDPRAYGLDGAMEFPPHKVAQGLGSIIENVEVTDLRFTGRVVSYDDMVANAAMSQAAPFPLLRGVTPSWDNDARRQGAGTVYHGSTPKAYEGWLSEAIDYARAHPFHGESVVFINAWNEWAEAAYLEPDVHFGAAYLNATARALVRRRPEDGKMRVALIAHDAHPHGAQLLVKNLARVLTRRFGVEVAIVVLGDGPLLDSYRALAPTYPVGRDAVALEQVLRQLRSEGYRSAIVNTTVSGRALPLLRRHGFFAVSLVHELPQLIRDYGLDPEVRQIAELAHLVVFAATEVRDAFGALAGTLDPEKTVIRPQGSYLPWHSDPKESRALRERLGLGSDGKLVINVGYADTRKGFDLFVHAASAICDQRDDLHFAWIGPVDATVVDAAMAGLADGSKARQHIHLVPFTTNPVPMFEAADLFFLSSREDPFPTVVLEALAAGLPVVGFEGSGGTVDLIRAHGALVPMGDVAAAAGAILGLIDQPLRQREAAAHARMAVIDAEFRFEDYVSDLLTMLEPDLPRVSVIVPNYRYAGYLPARLNSIYDQSCPVYEVLVLDDASPDDSLAELERYRQRSGNEFEVVVNERNSGSGYLQWAKGARRVRGDLVWIAEADDLAEPAFLMAARRVLEDREVAFVFCDSSQRDETDRLLATGYGYYFDTVEPGAMAQDFVMDGPEFVRRFLSIKNLILNVSGVLWRREALLAALDATAADHARMKVACDWKIYAHAALKGGKVGFVARPLNMHRRHSESVTQSRDVRAHYDEIIEVQDHIASQVSLDAATLARRDVYRAELRKQFGLE